MKHQYFGDVNDFRKYAILREFHRQTNLQIGFFWMLTPNDGRNDGSFTRYLDEPDRWRHYDPDLFDEIKLQVRVERTIRGVAARLVPGAMAFEEVIPDKRLARIETIQNGLNHLSDVGLVFFDPDNGIEVQSCRLGNKHSSKYVFWDEVIETYKRGQSVVVYQHFRRENRGLFIGRLIAEYSTRTGCDGVLCVATPHAAFFVLAQPNCARKFVTAVELLIGRWVRQIAVNYRNEAGPYPDSSTFALVV